VATPKKPVLVVTRVERFRLPTEKLAEWAAAMIADRGDYYTENGWSMHDAGDYLGEEVTAQVES